MVFVKVRETYDLHTVKNKMTVIGIHTPKPDIIKANFPGLLMQCKAYRPVSADVRIACASTLPVDPQGVGLTEGDVAPEDLFNPILYKACSNFGMSQIEARILALSTGQIGASQSLDVDGNSAAVEVDNTTSLTDEFPVYYGFLSNAHEFRHANPQQGLEMSNLRPLVYEVLYNIGDQAHYKQDNNVNDAVGVPVGSPLGNGVAQNVYGQSIRGNAKPLPFMNCTSYTGSTGPRHPGFLVGGESTGTNVQNDEQDVPWINCVVGCIIVPPSRLHELFYRMVVEWTIEFSQIRPISEITNWAGLSVMANITHYQNYSFEATKSALGVDGEVMDHSQTMVDANVEINKVM